MVIEIISKGKKYYVACQRCKSRDTEVRGDDEQLIYWCNNCGRKFSIWPILGGENDLHKQNQS